MREIYKLEQWQDLVKSIYDSQFNVIWLYNDSNYVYAAMMEDAELRFGKFNKMTNQGFVYARPRWI